MSEERAEDLGEVRARAVRASEALEAQAAEVLELAKRIEELTNGTPGWYPGMRARVEADETVRQVRVLVRALGDLDSSMRTRADEGGEAPAPKSPS